MLPQCLQDGITLMTVRVRRDHLTPKMKNGIIFQRVQSSWLVCHKKLLDSHGFVKTSNVNNFLIVRFEDYQIQVSIHKKVSHLARANQLVLKELNITLTEAYTANKTLCMDCCTSQVTIKEVDGSVIGKGQAGFVTEKNIKHYQRDRSFSLNSQQQQQQQHQHTLSLNSSKMINGSKSTNNEGAYYSMNSENTQNIDNLGEKVAQLSLSDEKETQM